MANASLSFVSLDQPTIKASLQAFLQSQSIFKDYDFVGSNLNVLLSLLAYNTSLNAFYTNMDLTEAYLDSAQMKSSVISRAKELNYTPSSARSASANVTLTFNGPQSTYTLLKGQSFSAVVLNTSLVFTLPDNIVLGSTNNFFSADLTLFEGQFISDSFILNSSDPTQRLVLENPTIDTTSLTVVVFENGSTIGVNYTFATTLLGLDETSKVFFVQQAENEAYEILFGDGVVGYRPADGSLIIADYRITVGAAGNEAQSFVINFNPGPTQDAFNIDVETSLSSQGGAPVETIESIRFHAPRHFEVQERATAAPDFVEVLQEQFPEITAVNAYGGEEVSPPKFGKVIVAVAIAGVQGLPQIKADEYGAFLAQRMFLTGVAEFVSPAFTYVGVSAAVAYDINVTTISQPSMQALIAQGISAYGANTLGTFGPTLRYSKLTTSIDDTDPSIVGNQTTLNLYKKLTPIQGAAAVQTVLTFGVPLAPDSDIIVQPDISGHCVWSSSFFVNGILTHIEDDGNGVLWYVQVTGSAQQFTQKVGTVDYANGIITLTSFAPTAFDGPAVLLFVRPQGKDVSSPQDTILSIEPSGIAVSVVQIAGSS